MCLLSSEDLAYKKVSHINGNSCVISSNVHLHVIVSGLAMLVRSVKYGLQSERKRHIIFCSKIFLNKIGQSLLTYAIYSYTAFQVYQQHQWVTFSISDRPSMRLVTVLEAFRILC